ncbi:MAG: hypothetical protein S0880_05030 [Actinomycetota bacterium]|nr:hypothetical protein [Actinomycetota bacterium]
MERPTEMFPDARRLGWTSRSAAHGSGVHYVFTTAEAPEAAAARVEAFCGQPSIVESSFRSWTRCVERDGQRRVEFVTVVVDPSSMPLVRRYALPRGAATFVLSGSGTAGARDEAPTAPLMRLLSSPTDPPAGRAVRVRVALDQLRRGAIGALTSVFGASRAAPSA